MCLLVHFTAADLEESRGNTDNSRQIYDDLIQTTLPKSDAAEPDASTPKEHTRGMQDTAMSKRYSV